MKIGILISARNKSKRLKNKLFLNINKIPIILGLIFRLSNLKLKFDHELVLCTSYDSNDKKLVNIAKKNNIKFYRGSKNDKLLRYYNCAKKNNYSAVIIVDGDDPLVYTKGINILIKRYKKFKKDFLYIENLPVGCTPYLIRTSALKYIINTKKIKNTEVWGNIFLDNKRIKSSIIKIDYNVSNLKKMRFTLDYKEDYDFFKKVLEIINYDWKMDLFRIIKKINQVNKNIYKMNIDCQNKYLEHLNNSRYNLT